MIKKVRNRHYFVTDIILLTFAAYLSFLLRLEDRALGSYQPAFIIFTALALLITPLIFRLTGVYARYWRYASVEELLLLSGSVAAAVALTGSISVLGPALFGNIPAAPRSIPFIFLLLALVATAGPRLAVRLTASQERRYMGSARRSPVLVIGAGEAGRMIVRELRHNAQLGMDVVGFVDDDPRKQGMRINGVLVLGDHRALPAIVLQREVEQVIIAMPAVPGKVIREIVRTCEHAGIHPKIMPGIYELLDRRVSVNQLRNVEIEDLLRREPVQTDTASVSELIHGKRVLITGGGGSIGSELCRQVLRSGPAELVVVGHGENSVFEIENELRKQVDNFGDLKTRNGKRPEESTPECRVTAVIADIRFGDRIRSIFEEYRPEIVFHAAAHKHVPLMELNPAEAISNNVLGTRNLLDAATAVGVEHFVMISTDKAVNPTNIMGASKRVAELLVHQAAKISGKPYVAVRFGNVLGSRGSVVLTFKQQIASGGPLCVTHPEMRRFFMTIPEAVQLVLQAAVLGHGGEVFVLNMGEPVKIVDLARDMIELSGLEVGQDIDIVYTGLRPGEKLFEELFVAGEEYQDTHHEKIFIARNASSFVPTALTDSIEALAEAARWNDASAIRRGLQALVPEYQPPQIATTTARKEERPVLAGEPLSLRVGAD